MTIDEAIKNREDCLKYLENIGRRANPECVEAVRWSVKALKAMRYKLGWLAYAYPPANIDKEGWTAEWVPMTDDDGCTWFECSKCEYDLDSLDEEPLFCLGCGRAMNEKAWAVLEKRLRG